MSRPQELGHWRGTGLREFSKCCKYHVSNQDGPSMMLVLVASLLWFFVPSARGSCGWVSVWLRKNWFVSHLSFILLCADFFQYYFSFPQYYGIKCRKTLSKNFLLPSLNWTTVWVASPIVWLHLSGAIDPCVEPAKSQCMAHRYHPTGEGFLERFRTTMGKILEIWVLGWLRKSWFRRKRCGFIGFIVVLSCLEDIIFIEVYDGCKFSDICMKSGLMRITISKRALALTVWDDLLWCFPLRFCTSTNLQGKKV